MLSSIAVAAVETDDEMVETWFARNRGAMNNTSEHALAEIALWFPIIGVPANDGSIDELRRP